MLFLFQEPNSDGSEDEQENPILDIDSPKPEEEPTVNKVTLQLSCDSCYLDFDSNSDFLSHILQLHNKELLTILGSDDRIVLLSTDKSHKSHTTMDSDNTSHKSHTTTDCDKKDNESVKEPVSLDPLETVFLPDECDKTSENKEETEPPLKKVKTENDCQIVHESKTAVLAPIQPKVSRRRQQLRHKCNHCGVKFLKQSHLTSHIWREHGGKDNFACCYCNRGYASNRSLLKHIRGEHFLNSQQNLI